MHHHRSEHTFSRPVVVTTGAVVLLLLTGCAALEQHLPQYYGDSWEGVEPGEESSWTDVGFGQSRAERWASVTIEDPERPGETRTVRIAPEEAVLYRQSGLLPKQAATWQDVYGGQASDIETYTAYHMTWPDIESWGEAGVITPPPGALLAAGVEPQEVAALREAGMGSRDIEFLLENGVEATRITEWQTILRDFSRRDLRSMLEVGMGPEAIAEVGPENARALREHDIPPLFGHRLLAKGLSIDAIREWREAHIPSDKVVEWAELDVGPEEAGRYQRRGLNPALVKRARPHCDDAPMMGGISKLGPNEVEGQCAYIGGRVLQIISENEALVEEHSDAGRGVIKVDFENGVPAGERSLVLHWLVVGTGTFQYNAMSGRRTVSRVRYVE